MSKSYYVYAHSKPDGEIFYVGKGSGVRLNQTGNRSKFWKRIVAKHGFTAEIIFDGLSEEESFRLEIETIAFYKPCANFTLGGDGVRVEKRWWNEAISKALTGKKRVSGKENPGYIDFATEAELRDLYITQRLTLPILAEKYQVSITAVWMRLKQYGIPRRNEGRPQVRVRCLTDGRVFDYQQDAADYYGVYRQNIRKVLKGQYKHTGGHVFVYA